MEFKNIEGFNKWADELERPCVVKEDIKINSFQPERLNPEDQFVGDNKMVCDSLNSMET